MPGQVPSRQQPLPFTEPGHCPRIRSVGAAKGRLPELSVRDGSDLCRPDIHVYHGFSAARVLRLGHFSCRATPCSVEGRDALDSCRQAASALTIAEVDQKRAVVCSRHDICRIVRLSGLKSRHLFPKDSINSETHANDGMN